MQGKRPSSLPSYLSSHAKQQKKYNSFDETGIHLAHSSSDHFAFYLYSVAQSSLVPSLKCLANRSSSNAHCLSLHRQLGANSVKSKTISMLDEIALSAVRFSRRLLYNYITAKVLLRLSVLTCSIINLQGGIILEASL